MANIKKIFIALTVIGLTFTAITAFAQTAKEAIFGLKKLQARCQSGISYRDYGNAVGDAKFPVNLFAESAEAKTNPQLLESINKVMKHYEFAGILWNDKISNTGLIYADSYLGKEIAQLYPQARLATNNSYWVDSLLPIIWAEASKELENATKLYAKTEGDTSNDIDKLKKENEQLKANAEIEKLKAENANLKKQLEVLKSKRNK